MLYDFFDNWSPENAYFFGLLWADGSLYKTRFNFGLKLEDEALVRLFSNKIKHDGVFTVSKPCLRSDGVYSSGFIEFNVVNKRMSDDLRAKGLVENKSNLDLPFPKVPDHLLWHFIRGFFDGDGSVFKTSQGYYRVSLVGTPLFLNQLRDKVVSENKLLQGAKLKKHCRSFVWYLEWSKKEQVLSFLCEMYKMSGDLFLVRKKNKSYEFIKQLKEDLDNKGIGKKCGRWRLRHGEKHIGYFDDLEKAKFVRNELYGWKDLTND